MVPGMMVRCEAGRSFSTGNRPDIDPYADHH
jgi:hypothetical protein